MKGIDQEAARRDWMNSKVLDVPGSFTIEVTELSPAEAAERILVELRSRLGE